VCDLETSRIGAPYIYDISNLRVKPNCIPYYLSALALPRNPHVDRILWYRSVFHWLSQFCYSTPLSVFRPANDTRLQAPHSLWKFEPEIIIFRIETANNYTKDWSCRSVYCVDCRSYTTRLGNFVAEFSWKTKDPSVHKYPTFEPGSSSLYSRKSATKHHPARDEPSPRPYVLFLLHPVTSYLFGQQLSFSPQL